MSELPRSAIPYEKQQQQLSCGAAALCMLYRSFGHACTQADVWQSVSPQHVGGRPARTYHLAADALRRGFCALVVKAHDPWRLLRRCHDLGTRVILNHRLNREQAAGHYSVLVELGDEYVLLHDPQAGPEQRHTRDELLQLWQPRRPRTDITGNVLVAVSPTPSPASGCPLGHEAIPAALACCRCRKPTTLQPATVLGCMTEGCPHRVWTHLFCPHCDGYLTLKAAENTALSPARD